MRTGLIAEKVGMTQIFAADGTQVPVTVLKVEECLVVGKRTVSDNGYNAVQIATINVKSNRLTKPLREFYLKQDLEMKKCIKEFRVDDIESYSIGSKIQVNHFSVGQCVDVTGFSVGKGFSGAMKRHNFGGLRASHGVSVSHRSHGSTGNRQDPGKVFKNKKMAGHMGQRKVTKMNLTVYDIDVDKGLLFVKGSVPGSKNTLIMVRDAIKKSNRQLGASE